MQRYKINRARHAAFLLHVHLVFVTKYRLKVLGELHYAAFHQYASEVCRDFGAELKESNGNVDHIHMLIEYPPTVQLSVLVNSLKAVTSRRLRNEFLDLRGAYGKAVLWSRSYFVMRIEKMCYKMAVVINIHLSYAGCYIEMRNGF